MHLLYWVIPICSDNVFSLFWFCNNSFTIKEQVALCNLFINVFRMNMFFSSIQAHETHRKLSKTRRYCESLSIGISRYWTTVISKSPHVWIYENLEKGSFSDILTLLYLVYYFRRRCASQVCSLSCYAYNFPCAFPPSRMCTLFICLSL